MPRNSNRPYYSSKNWCFILNDYDSCPRFLTKTMNYLTYGFKEREDGTKYLQGFVNFKSFFKAPYWYSPNAEWTPLVGSGSLAIHHCHDNSDDIKQFGVQPNTPFLSRPFKGSYRQHYKKYLHKNCYTMN